MALPAVEVGLERTSASEHLTHHHLHQQYYGLSSPFFRLLEASLAAVCCLEVVSESRRPLR